MTIEAGSVASALRTRRPRAVYNDAERRFSTVLHERLQEVLRGQRNRLELLRQYHQQANRLGVMATPPGLARAELRLEVVQALVWEALAFFCPEGAGGVVAQRPAPGGGVVEVQSFATRYPHIVIERTDRYPADSAEAEATSWALQRVQNQREQTQINRLLDAANLVVGLLGDLPFGPRR